MKAEEVMIGDWVHIKNFRNLQLELDQFYAQGCHCFKGDIIDYFETFEPIPLTAEILEKNGFRLHARYNGYGYTEENIWMDYNHNIEVVIADYTRTIRVFTDDGIDHEGTNLLFLEDRGRSRYVHELQQALRLCGLGELADNFKI